MCRYKCHKDCEREISKYSCGLTDELLKEASRIYRDTSRHNIQGNTFIRSHILYQSIKEACSVYRSFLEGYFAVVSFVVGGYLTVL